MTATQEPVTFEEWLENLSDVDRQRLIDHLIAKFAEEKRKLEALMKKILPGGTVYHGLIADDDPRYDGPREGKVRGFLPDDDAIYQDGGFLWRFIMGENLNPNISRRKRKGPGKGPSTFRPTQRVVQRHLAQTKLRSRRPLQILDQ
jgi:hypothetical protein